MSALIDYSRKHKPNIVATRVNPNPHTLQPYLADRRAAEAAVHSSSFTGSFELPRASMPLTSSEICK